MANRPVFAAYPSAPFFRVWNAEFNWNPGLSVSQKQKNIRAIHEAFTARFPGGKVLEISSKSMQEGGQQLSAFALTKLVPSLGIRVPVECAYQAGKVFEGGGPYTDLLHVSPREAKRDERLKNSGRLTSFCFDGVFYPSEPVDAFYDFLYAGALLENEGLARLLLQYDAFTDIEFSPAKSLNCQARAAARFVALAKMRRLGDVREFSTFCQ